MDDTQQSLHFLFEKGSFPLKVPSAPTPVVVRIFFNISVFSDPFLKGLIINMMIGDVVDAICSLPFDVHQSILPIAERAHGAIKRPFHSSEMAAKVELSVTV